MTWQVKLKANNTQLAVACEPAPSSETRTYLAFEDSPTYDGTSDTTWTIYALAKGTSSPWSVIPKVGQRLYPGSTDSNARQLLVETVEVEVEPSRANAWNIIVRASAPLVGNKGYASVDIIYQQRSRMADVYIAQASYPANGDAPWPPTSLISGSVVNTMGEPVRSMVPGASIVIAATYNPTADINGTYWMTTMPPTLDLVNRSGLRNSSAFLGYPTGSLVFLGHEERRLSEEAVQISWNLAYDGAYHLNQVPYRRPTDGSLWLDTLYAWGGGGNQARGTSKAAWFQPYSGTKINYNTAGQLFPQEVLTYLANPFPAW